jgi:hypothetical protein
MSKYDHPVFFRGVFIPLHWSDVARLDEWERHIARLPVCSAAKTPTSPPCDDGPVLAYRHRIGTADGHLDSIVTACQAHAKPLG